MTDEKYGKKTRNLSLLRKTHLIDIAHEEGARGLGKGAINELIYYAEDDIRDILRRAVNLKRILRSQSVADQRVSDKVHINAKWIRAALGCRK